MGIFDRFKPKETKKEDSKSTIRRDETGQFEFIADVNDDNSVPKNILNELELHLKRYEPSEDIHYHLYDKVMFFGATKEHGIFLCIYCKASKMPLQLIEKDGIHMQDHRQIIGESLNDEYLAEKHSAKMVYIVRKIDPSFEMPPLTIREERESTTDKLFELLEDIKPNWEILLPEKTQTLSEKGVKVVTDFLGEHNDICIFDGSFCTIPSFLPELRRVPKDINVNINVGEEEVKQFASNLLTRLRDVGENVRTNPSKNWKIESWTNGKWERAVDIRYKGEPFEDPLSTRTPEDQLRDLQDIYRFIITQIELAKLNPLKKHLVERCEFLFQRWQKAYGDIDFSKLDVKNNS